MEVKRRLLIKTEYLITYSLHDREFLMGWPGAFITKDPLKKNPVTGLSMIRIKGLDGKLYMFPAESCKTWFVGMNVI